MKGNPKISITAEAVAFIRSEQKIDKYSKYFVTSRIQRKFGRLRWIIPKTYLNGLIKKRAELSKVFKTVIKTYKPEQIIELACGYSAYGLEFSQNKKIKYIEADFPNVIREKKKLIKKISQKENLKDNKNHFLIPLDLLSDNYYKQLRPFINTKKKTLIIAEAVTPYFNSEQHDIFVKNIFEVMRHLNKAVYFSHEKSKEMMPGIFGNLIKKYRDKISKSKSYTHFKNASEAQRYFRKKGFTEFNTLEHFLRRSQIKEYHKTIRTTLFYLVAR